MKLNEILQLDLRKKGSKDIMLEALMEKLPFFKGEIPTLEDLEKAMHKMTRKYPIILSYIMPGPVDEVYYTWMVKRTDNNDWVKTIYSHTLYEGMAKVTIFMYAYIQNNFKKAGE